MLTLGILTYRKGWIKLTFKKKPQKNNSVGEVWEHKSTDDLVIVIRTPTYTLFPLTSIECRTWPTLMRPGVVFTLRFYEWSFVSLLPRTCAAVYMLLFFALLAVPQV